MAAELQRAPSLAGVMEELGYVCSQGEAAIREVLAQLDTPVDEDTVAEVLAMMARTHAGLDDPHGTQASLAAALGDLALGPADDPPAGAPQQTWNADAVVDALAAAAPSLDWREVAQRMDVPGLDLPDGAAFVLLIKAWQRGARGEPFPLPAVLGHVWANAAGQLAFLRWATAAPPEVCVVHPLAQTCLRNDLRFQGMWKDKI